MKLNIISIRRAAVAPPLLALLAAVLLAGGGGARSAQPATPGAGPAPTPDPAVVALERAVEHLVAQQTDDGAFVGFSGEADPGVTTDAVLALKAADVRGIAVTDALAGAARYLEDAGPAYAEQGVGQAAKLALAAVATGTDPRAFAGVDLLAAMTGGGTATPAADGTAVGEATPAVPGVYGTGLYDHALVMLALAAAGAPVPAPAVDALRGAQAEDGSWAFDGATEAGAGDSNTTALAVQALVAAGAGGDPAVAAALEYLRSVQTVTGQFAFQAADPLAADANSTALAVQAIAAAGQDPASPDDWNNAFRGLAAFQNVSGGFRYQDTEPADNLLATLQAMPALAGIPLPVATACAEEEAAPGTPVVALPSAARSQTPCVELAPAA